MSSAQYYSFKDNKELIVPSWDIRDPNHLSPFKKTLCTIHNRLEYPEGSLVEVWHTSSLDCDFHPPLGVFIRRYNVG